MTRSEQLAIRILAKDPLEVQSILQDWMRSAPKLVDERAPQSLDPMVRAVAAGIVELLAERLHQEAPAWVASVGRLVEPLYLVDASTRSTKMRARVERESPESLRKRNVFAPSGYLELL